MRLSNNEKAFFALLRAGLWETDVQLLPYGKVDFNELFNLAQEQSVIGLVAAGLEKVEDVKPTKQEIMPFLASVISIENQNKAMNAFVARLTKTLREKDVYALLIKGQGVAQCYERPLWRASGDVDLFLNEENYQKAKAILPPMASSVEKEFSYLKHLGMTIDGFVVELHGAMKSRLSRRIDNEIDRIQDKIFREGAVRSWNDDGVDVFLPAVNEDLILVFTHILRHFFFEGIGLRQICDWCRMLFTYKDKIDVRLLEQRLKKMQLMSEWKAFAAYAVDYLGMPADAMPLYDGSRKWSRKANRINTFVLKAGNFGHNQTKVSNRKQPYLVRKFISFWEHLGYTLRQFAIFPLDSIRFFIQVIRSGLHAIAKGE